jgi:hypothetical protein
MPHNIILPLHRVVARGISPGQQHGMIHSEPIFTEVQFKFVIHVLRTALESLRQEIG